MNHKNKSRSKSRGFTICLNMIVKNESHIIEQTLESICKYIDYWVISDTGSTDGTQDIIRGFFSKKGIPGELVEHVWKNFGHNRTKAFEAAFNKTDYAWIIDADDLVEGELQFPKKMKADVYKLNYRNSGEGFTYEREQIFNNRLGWCYVGVLHEYPECTTKQIVKTNGQNNVIPGNYFIRSRRLGARSQDSEKYAKDARILSQAFAEELANKEAKDKLNKALGITNPKKDNTDILVPRYCFYAAQSYRDYGDIDNAIKYYRLRTTLDGYDEEIYYSYIQLGSLLQKKAREDSVDLTDEIIKIYNAAYAKLNTRSESYYYLGLYYWHKKELEKAYFALKIISTKSFPHSHTFFMDRDVHTWKGRYKFAKLCICLGKLSEAQPVLENLLNNKQYRQIIKIKRLYNQCQHSTLPELKKLYDQCRNEPFDSINHPLIQYNPDKVKLIQNRNNSNMSQTTLTVTTCKRLDLFKKTMNSFINCCEDICLINRFLCVDDNSSESDRAEMKSLYPFFEFINKGPDQKGHRASMNIIAEQVKTPYVLHMEDDFLFIDKANYIEPAIQILTQKKIIELDDIPADQDIHSKEIAQVLFTRNYQEEIDRYIPGGYLAITANNPKIKYVVHEHYPPDTDSYVDAVKSYGPCNVYWPHFSFRPSMMKTSIFKKLGKFDLEGFFERAYADKYYANGYISTFFDKVSCLHIGKLTHESTQVRKNAYEMNQENQFVNTPKNNVVDFTDYDFYPNSDSFGHDIFHHPNKTIQELKSIADSTPECIGFNTWGYFKNQICHENDFIKLKNHFNAVDGLYVKKKKSEIIVNTINHKILCVNLLRRPDRKQTMTNMFNKNSISPVEFFEAVDGSKLEPTEYIRNLFMGNDFNYRRGFVGCALSHYNIWKNLVEDKVNEFYLIFEDDINYFDDAYVTKLNQILQKINTTQHDIIYLGYTMFPTERNSYAHLYNKSDRSAELRCLNKRIYLGGFFNYIITKNGARKILKYIDVHGIKHGIDYVAKMVPDLLMYEVQPQLAFSEWVQSNQSEIDSDIQKNYDCLTWNNPPKIEHTIKTSSSKFLKGEPPEGMEEAESLEISNSEFTYHAGLDSPGNDIVFVDRKEIKELMDLCKTDPNCVGFNTLGFLKSKIGTLKKSQYFGANDGLYVYNKRNKTQSNSATSLESQFEFHKGLDSHSYDLEFVGKKPIHELMAIAEKNPKCVCFNTLGFMKYYVRDLKPSIYFKDQDGVYVHLARYKNQVKKTRVKMICNWASSQNLCNEINHMTQGNLEWNNLQLTSENDDIDYYVILNNPGSDRNYDPAKTIIIQLEPWCYDETQNWGVKTWGEWAEPSEEKFMHVRTHRTHVNTPFWQLGATYTDFKTKPITKTFNHVSSICSSKYFDPGHIKRIDFIKYVESKNDSVVKIDVYNHDNKHNFRNYMGPHPPKNKDAGITPYKYYFMAENNQEKNFITEKIWEPLLTETLCFYWGCPNISDWVDPRAYVVLDLDDFEKSFQIMKTAIMEDWWSDRLEVIRKEKQKLLDYYFMMPTIERIITESAMPDLTKICYRKNFTESYYNQTVCFIHSCNLGNLDVLDSLISHLIDSGLMNVLDHVWIINVGQPINKTYPGISIIQYDSNTATFELQTLNLIYKFSDRNPGTKVLYLHTKGVSYGKSHHNITDWTNLMLHFLVDKYEKAILLLDNSDAVGVNYLDTPHKHFSGNFWWSKTNHIRRLGPILSGIRHDAEWWILSKPDTIHIELYNSHTNHYQNEYPKNLYS